MIATLALAAFLVAPSLADDPARILAAPKYTWVGIDYTHTHMVSITDFQDPAAIFPAMLDNWNALWVKEMVEPMTTTLERGVDFDVNGMMERNKTATAQLVHREIATAAMADQYKISRDEIATMVKSYKLTATEGVGFGLIGESMLKEATQACFQAVFFDIPTREVLATTRYCGVPNGFGFRNFWFRPAKDTLMKGVAADLKVWKKGS